MPLTYLTCTTGTTKKSACKIVWEESHKQAFEKIKKVVAREVLLAYPRFDQPFIIYTDASKYQLGSVITQNNRTLEFYSRKFNSAERRKRCSGGRAGRQAAGGPPPRDAVRHGPA